MVGRRVGGMIRDLCAKNQFAEVFMGSKPSHAMQSNRPESGGADRDERQEKSGLLEREKQQFAQAEQDKRDASPASDDDRDESSNRMTGDKGELND